MSAIVDTTVPAVPVTSRRWLNGTAALWFSVAALGQAAFVYFIAAFYGNRTASGNLAGWNDKPIIEGFVAGDAFGNLMFISHVLVAAVITLGGLHQLIPALRNRWPLSHRIVGRVFVATAYFMAFSGLWLTWIRGTYLSVISGIATSINGLLIFWFVTAAVFMAVNHRFADHRRWALRAFIAVNGVWFFRLGIMAWVIINQGPVGMNETLSGPADIAISFGSYLLPLALLELYLRAGRNGTETLPRVATATLMGATALTGLGIFGTVAFMWGPYL